MRLYELPPGQTQVVYHFHHGNDEAVVVLRGCPTVRTPEGERELAPWDTICFPASAEGAHKVTNRTEEPARVAMLSTKNDPGVSFYPDSNKVGVWPPGKLFRIDDRHRAAVIARDVMADADGDEFDRRAILDLLDHIAQMPFEIIAGVDRQG